MPFRNIGDAARDRVFLAYGETGNVRAAARAAGVDPATASRWLRDPRNVERLKELVAVGRQRLAIKAQVDEMAALEAVRKRVEDRTTRARDLAHLLGATIDASERLWDRVVASHDEGEA